MVILFVCLFVIVTCRIVVALFLHMGNQQVGAHLSKQRGYLRGLQMTPSTTDSCNLLKRVPQVKAGTLTRKRHNLVLYEERVGSGCCSHLATALVLKT